jgi:hypothetical protein
MPIDRHKATSISFPGFGPATVAEAVIDLTKPGFVLWVWMCNLKADTLKLGRRRISQLFGCSKDRLDELLLELRRKGYISYIHNGPYKKSTIKIERKLKVRLGESIVRAV